MEDGVDHLTKEKGVADEEGLVDAEEALSLSDFPLTATAAVEHHGSTANQDAADQFFEFLTNLSSGASVEGCCSADDVIFCGRLLPFVPNSSPRFPARTVSCSSHLLCTPTDSSNSARIQTRRSESLNLSKSKTLSAKTQRFMMRPSRSLDYRKLHRSNSTLKTDSSALDRNLLNKSSRGSKSDFSNSDHKAPKLPWYWLMSGLVRFPIEMELKDIKNRQLRRNPSALFPADSDRISDHRTGQKKDSSWRLLSVLSCKNHASVGVAGTSSFPSIPHV
ncbi:hypothetical protein Nepgr_025107 [Nepenthes gracilis]|uniref:Uncharacterized protein n=1 Tax=Nepenthes gracilis TaxID=150966 RepID=A0AAD3Y0N8_NEPGR|nr:hypothetical protein Nepgr_025107 [Nepenthes gracilis]